MKNQTRTYSDLIRFDKLIDRFNYLKLSSVIGEKTFGSDRYLNQIFYKTPEWKKIRNIVIVRDNGCDLGVPGFDIYDKILIHHMNPITKEAILQRQEDILNPEYLICVSSRTHQAIHFSDASLLPDELIIRKPGDTTLWKKQRR